MSKLGDFDVNQLMLMLHGELQLAFQASQDAEKVSKLRVEQVNVKMGQRGILPRDEETGNASLLDPGRYPDEEDWEVNLSYRHGDPLPESGQSVMWISSPTSGLILERLKDLPVNSVKGIDRVWDSRLHDAGVSTIEDLVDCPAGRIRELCRQYRSLQPLEFQTLVLLLAREFSPLKFSEFYAESLTGILLESNENLKKHFRGKLSEPEISSLKAMAAIICTVIDKQIHGGFSLQLLSPAVAKR